MFLLVPCNLLPTICMSHKPVSLVFCSFHIACQLYGILSVDYSTMNALLTIYIHSHFKNIPRTCEHMTITKKNYRTCLNNCFKCILTILQKNAYWTCDKPMQLQTAHKLAVTFYNDWMKPSNLCILYTTNPLLVHFFRIS